MCSSSMCDVAGLINGPVGNLVGMGIRALVNGAPVGPRSAEDRQKSSEQENIKKFYDNVEAHLKGTLRVLQPAMEINRILLGECKSTGHEKQAPTSDNPIVYYTPQISKKSLTNHCPAARCCSLKKTSENRDNARSVSPKTPYSYSDRSIPQQKDSSSVAKCWKKSKENPPKMCFSPIESETSARSCGTSENRGQSCSASKKSPKSKQVCWMCKTSLRDNSLLALLPCKHFFCYKCLARAKYPKCQKCDKSFDMKNITRISAAI